MKAKRLSSIVRPIDLSYPTNRMIVVITLLFLSVTTGFQLVSGRGTFPAFYAGLMAGASVFLAWAFAREIDPDNELSAFVAAFFSGIGFIFFPSPLLLTLLLELMLLRIVNRSTGLPARTLDSFAILLLSGWILLHGGWIYSIPAFLAFVLDAFLPEPKRSQLAFAGVLFIFLLLSAEFISLSGNEGEKLSTQSTGLSFFVLTVALLFIPHVFKSRTIKSKGDLTGITLNPLRVQTAQLMTLLSVSLPAVLQGWAGVENLMPLWGTVLGVAVYRDSELLFKKLSGGLARNG